MTQEEIIRLAVDAGIQAYREERRQEAQRVHHKKLHNTELLLKNYRAFKAMAENAVYRAEDCQSLEQIILDLMDEGNKAQVTVLSIKRSAARTATIVQHMERMLELYKESCMSSTKPEDVRRWKVIDGLYIQEPRQTVAKLAGQEFVSERQIYEDRNQAIAKIAIYMFGVDVAFQEV